MQHRLANSRRLTSLALLLLPLLSICGCATARRPITVDVANNATVIQEDGQPTSTVEERFFILEQGSLTAIKTYYRDGSRDVRFFRPDNSAFLLFYRNGRLVSESHFDKNGILLRKCTFNYGDDGKLQSVTEEVVPPQAQATPGQAMLLPPEAAQVFAPGDHIRTVKVNGTSREFILHVPAGLPKDERVPLVIVLHGALTNAEYVESLTRMSALADKQHFIVAYPNARGWVFGGIVRTWNVGQALHHPGVNDVAYVAALMDMLAYDLPVDTRRVYVVGISMGAMLTYELGTQLPTKIAAMAAVSGSMSGVERLPEQPVPVLIIHGTSDTIVPFLGGGWLSGFLMAPTMKPVAYAQDFWVNRNGATTLTVRKVSDHVLHEAYTGGRAPVERYTIFGGIHTWPGTTIRNLYQQPSEELCATEAIWAFLSKHKR